MNCSRTADLSGPVSALLSILILLVAGVLVVSTAQRPDTKVDVIGLTLLHEENNEPYGDSDHSDDNSWEGHNNS